MAQMYVYTYEQLLAIVNQQAVTIAQQVATINNLRTERDWLDEDNQLQREEVEKATKKITDKEKNAKLKESKLKKEILQVEQSQQKIKQKHQNAVRELNDLKSRNMKIKSHCTSLLDKLDKGTQELQQKQEELERIKQELDLGYSLGESMYQHLRYYYWGYFDLLKYFQRPRPPTGGATITELDTMPHSYSVTQEVRVSPKPTSETVIVPAPVNTVTKTETDYRTAPVAQNVIQSLRRNTICPQTAYILTYAPSRDLNPIEVLLFNNNNCSFIFKAPEVPQLLALENEVPTRPGNHRQLLAICPPEWANAAIKIPRAIKAANRAPRIRKNTTPSNITSCNKTCGSSPKKTKEEHESGSEPPKVGHCQPTTAFSEHRLDANKLFTDGEKEFLTRKDERRASEEKKPKALVSWLKNYRYSTKLNWPKMVSVVQLMKKILGV